ncbi:MAG: glutathione S-transferase C-terminal domain-containing protein [Halioglobus sp.]
MADFMLWGVVASPYLLKMQSILDYAEHKWQRWPDQSTWPSGLKMMRNLNKARKLGLVERFPERVAGMDEYPAVPFYTEDGAQFFYDSSGLALHLDQHADRHESPLVPADPALAFVCRLIDEAFDEFGLYMVHHNRWVTSAKTNTMGIVTGGEMGKLLPVDIGKLVAWSMPKRQVRRCPYLFSVAPEGFEAGVSRALTPPSRQGFPATHKLLDTAWRNYLAAMEALLLQQPYLLGDRFTLADASAYGQLSMNLIDGAAADLMRELAPTTYHWLCGIRDGSHISGRGELYLGDCLNPLLGAIAETFIPLMQQNAAAYADAVAGGETLFNEAAFDQGRALYRGELMGHPFHAVAKSFQIPVWRDLCSGWSALEESTRQQLAGQFDGLDNKAFLVSAGA